jgi:hypothetical protein
VRVDAPETVSLPLFPLGTVLFPGTLLPLHVFEPRYRALLRDRRDHDPVFGIVLTRRGNEVADQPETHAVGTAATLVGARSYTDGRYDIAIRGGRRFRVLDGDWSTDYLTATIAWLDEPTGDMTEATRTAQRAVRAFDQFVDAIAKTAAIEPTDNPFESEDPVELSYAIAARLPLNTWERQEVLETDSAVERLGLLTTILRREQRLLAETGVAGTAALHGPNTFSPN